jgi:4-hydroxymandelate oxidase
MPILLAPAAAHKLCCPDGELATARAAHAAGTIMVLSTVSTVSMEDVASSCQAPRWFQLYVYQDREVTRNLVQRADIRNSFSVPYPLANLTDMNLQDMPTGVVGSGLGAYISSKWDPSLSWNDVDWLSSITRLPVLLKGILTAEDAAMGINHGADVLKALALGARAVLIGRPYLYGLALGGEDGVRRVLDILKAEFATCMTLSGRPTIPSIDKTLVELRPA